MSSPWMKGRDLTINRPDFLSVRSSSSSSDSKVYNSRKYNPILQGSYMQLQTSPQTAPEQSPNAKNSSSYPSPDDRQASRSSSSAALSSAKESSTSSHVVVGWGSRAQVMTEHQQRSEQSRGSHYDQLLVERKQIGNEDSSSIRMRGGVYAPDMGMRTNYPDGGHFSLGRSPFFPSTPEHPIHQITPRSNEQSSEHSVPLRHDEDSREIRMTPAGSRSREHSSHDRSQKFDFDLPDLPAGLSSNCKTLALVAQRFFFSTSNQFASRISKSDLNLHFKLAGVHQKVPSYDETFEEFWKLLDDGRQGWVDYGFMLEFMKLESFRKRRENVNYPFDVNDNTSSFRQIHSPRWRKRLERYNRDEQRIQIEGRAQTNSGESIWRLHHSRVQKQDDVINSLPSFDNRQESSAPCRASKPLPLPSCLLFRSFLPC
uniref:EF-hand domain-containing protein n=1 Tax=Guillardia theta TaxID=55529 RepID=A0A6U6CTA6_GUITH|mmetsp:Transcript_48731/g.152964  ORF Transcript_48731/g.152964 Transcript_48731/m.152964 type:complete len:428 (+) Transcript_48731:235-1518(+)